MDDMKNINPNVALICAASIFVTMIGAVVALVLSGASTDSVAAVIAALAAGFTPFIPALATLSKSGAIQQDVKTVVEGVEKILNGTMDKKIVDGTTVALQNAGVVQTPVATMPNNADGTSMAQDGPPPAA